MPTKPPYRGQSRLEQLVERLDERVGGLLVRLEKYLVRRWPGLARWISD